MRARFAIVLFSGMLSLAACTNPGSASPSASGSAASVADLPQGDEPITLDPATFSAEIDNPYWPIAVGSRWTFREFDAEQAEFKVVVTVSSETKQIANGVTARVVRDTVTDADGAVVEDTIDWYAQDADGAIWYLGEQTAEFDGGEVVSTEGSFEAGVDGALPGIAIPANPAVGMRYRQEYYAGHAEDNGQILSTAEIVEVPYGAFDDAVLTRDTITIEPDVVEYKLYARGMGPVLVFGVSGGGGHEELVAFETVGADVARAAGTTPLGEAYS